MTVSEFIEVLKTYPPDAVCAVDGYEGGFDLLTPELIFMQKIQRSEVQETYMGEYDDPYCLRGNPDPLLLSVIFSRPIKLK